MPPRSFSHHPGADTQPSGPLTHTVQLPSPVPTNSSRQTAMPSSAATSLILRPASASTVRFSLTKVTLGMTGRESFAEPAVASSALGHRLRAGGFFFLLLGAA